jgi:uncharacterized protein YuzE
MSLMLSKTKYEGLSLGIGRICFPKSPRRRVFRRRRNHILPGFLLSQRRYQSCEVKMAQTTEFPLAAGPISRPVDVIRLLAKGGLPLKIARSVVERLATADIKGRYDHERDRLYIEIVPGPSAESREMGNSLKVDLDAGGNVIGFDIDNASHLGALLRDFVASGATLEDLARAWASLDGKRDEFDMERDQGASKAASSHYLRHLMEAEEILRRAAKDARGRSSASSAVPANAATPAVPAETTDARVEEDWGQREAGGADAQP